MRWGKAAPVYGSERIVLRFAWFPVRLHDGWLWLERYQARQVYHCGWWDSDYWETMKRKPMRDFGPAGEPQR